MSKITKKQLQHSVDLLNKENSSQHDYLMRIKRALKSIDIDILSDEFDEPKPQLKQLDQSVFDGLDEKWRWFGVNSDGSTIMATNKPKINVSNNGFILLIGESELSDDNYDTSNWQNSLIERSTAKELTGSELCKTMLERGDNWVVCRIADTSDEDALNNGRPILVTKFDGDFYHKEADQYWKYAVPINNQGEPMTASEVGL